MWSSRSRARALPEGRWRAERPSPVQAAIGPARPPACSLAGRPRVTILVALVGDKALPGLVLVDLEKANRFEQRREVLGPVVARVDRRLALRRASGSGHRRPAIVPCRCVDGTPEDRNQRLIVG